MRASEVSSSRDTRSGMEISSSFNLCEAQLHREIEHAMSEFGRELLTARERAVVRLILLGLPSKVAALKLQIAPKTEGVHRRNAYAKLGVRSQAALFRQFLDFLSESWTQLEVVNEARSDERDARATRNAGVLRQ